MDYRPYAELFDGKVILITGGTGSFSTKFVEILLDHYNPSSIRIFSRDELKQSEMQRRFADDDCSARRAADTGASRRAITPLRTGALQAAAICHDSPQRSRCKRFQR